MVMAEPIRRTPVRVGFYDILRTIGKGNFAVVKLARHRITKTEVAIKIIEKSRLDQSNLRKIYREIQILKLLRHQHIIKLYQVIETKTTIFLITEYASHGEVFDYITQEEKLPEEKAKRMFYQVLTAIEYCHKNNVVHRDLKAENLLLDSNDNIKLADFGFGNFFQTGQNLHTWCGSPPYAAPEVFEGKLYEGPQLDVWSLGIVLYVLVCGTFPFDGSNLVTLKERVLAGRFRIPYWMSQDCENLIRRMLVVQPKKRLTIAQIKKHKWMQTYAKKPEISIRKSESPVRRACSQQLPEFNEHILKLMQNLNVDRQKTIESLRNSAYDDYYAIYHLLVDRLKHHRTSVPLDTKFSYNTGERRPSNIADQTVVKRNSGRQFISHTTPWFTETNRYVTNQQAFPFSPLEQSSIPPHDDVTNADSFVSSEVRFPETGVQELSAVQRTLALSQLQYPAVLPPSTSPTHIPAPRVMTRPAQGQLPRQPWSANSYLRTHVDMVPAAQTRTRCHGSGKVIASVTSIDEGVELIGVPSNDESMMTNLHIAPSYHHHAHDVTESPHDVFQVESQVDTMIGTENTTPAYEKDAFSDSMDINCDVIHPQHLHTSSCDVTPAVVLSPCPNEFIETTEQESRCMYIENQRQLLDVSPTGFREGRRASDGLLLLGEGRIGEHLKRLARVHGFPAINQEEHDEECFETTEAGKVLQRCPHQQVALSTTKQGFGQDYGAVSSNSTQHFMQIPRSEAINFQPYESTRRRRSLQVSQYVAEGRSGSYSKDLSTPFVQPIAEQLQVFHQSSNSCVKPVDDYQHQWSSWKAVTDPEMKIRDYTDGAQRRDTIPLLVRTNLTTFSVASDDSMRRNPEAEVAKRHPSLPNPGSGHQMVAHQSLGQQLHQRRLIRRLKVACNSKPSCMNYQIPLPELEQLRIEADVNFGQALYQNEALVFTAPSKGDLQPALTPGAFPQFQRGEYPSSQLNFSANANELQQPTLVADQGSPVFFLHDSQFAWNANPGSTSFPPTSGAPEYAYS